MISDEKAFATLIPVREFAEALGVPWWIAGGWATDLFLGRVTRKHGDVDLLVLDRDQDVLRGLWLEGRLERLHKGELSEWRADEVLVAGPDLLRPTGGRVAEWKVELMIGMTRGDAWVFHRGNLSIERTINELGAIGTLGLPFLVPEVSLRTRARFNRESDELDFQEAAPAMSSEQRRWLRESLPREHPWLAELREAK